MTDSNNSLRLPIEPFLGNSTIWWIDTFCPEGDIRRQHADDGSLRTQQELRDEYHQWMREQGVVIKGPTYVYQETDPCLDFVDEQSMVMFILRWSN